MKRTLVLTAAMVFGLLLFGLAPPSHATATLILSSGATTVTIYDQDFTASVGTNADFNAGAGAVTFIGAVGNFFLNVTTGLSSAPPNTFGDTMHLNSVDTTQALAGGTLTIRFIDTGFTLATPGFKIALGPLLSAGATITYSACFDTSNAGYNSGTGAGPCSGGTLINTIGPMPAPGTAAVAFGPGPGSSTPYSLEQVITLTMPANATSSFDASINPVPEPGSLALLGSGLLGLAGFARRKFKK